MVVVLSFTAVIVTQGRDAPVNQQVVPSSLNAPFHGSTAKQIRLPAEEAAQTYRVEVWLRDPVVERTGASEPSPQAANRSKQEGSTEAATGLDVQVVVDGKPANEKRLHTGDPDFFSLIRVEPDQKAVLRIGRSGRRTLAYEGAVRSARSQRKSAALQSNESGAADEATLAKLRALLEAEPNNNTDQATVIRPGQTVFASADDRPFIAALGQEQEKGMDSGVDWYRFDFKGTEPKLGFFWIDFLDREVPVDVALFQKKAGKLVEYGKEFERFEPERSTKYVGMYKFVARRLDPGEYFLRVKANHPIYQLRSELYPLPPYDPATEGGLRAAAQQAIRTAQDYILLKGESWHANTPRVGAVADRVRSIHAETAQCLACHPTHFSTRGAVISMSNGFPARRRPALRFLTERLYNNPRPFYGHPEAHWARMISAGGNVVSRLSIMLDIFEETISGRPRPSVHRDVAEYLKLYYKDRDELPKDESNGNRPLVSAFEVATHSWMVFDDLYEQTNDESYARWRERVRKLIESPGKGKVKDMLDLCYQTIAFCRIDRNGYSERIQENVDRILSYQREDGQWPMKFGEEQPSAEFQTGHCLYTLALAGVSVDKPGIQKGIRFLLKQQKPFGAWYDDDDPDDPHPYENFQTPFRETQFALMALSEFFPEVTDESGKGSEEGTEEVDDETKDSKPGAKAELGWQAGYSSPPKSLNEESVPGLLAELDGIWVSPTKTVRRELIETLNHPNPLARQAAAACLGRVGKEPAVEPLIKALGDHNKGVRRAAAWALRQLGNRGLGYEAVTQAVSSSDSRIRRGAMQVFAQHGRYWVSQSQITQRLIEERMNDPDPVIRMLACRVLWQWWYWSSDPSIKAAIEDAYLDRMALESHPWARKNLIDGFYNLCDENIRYLHNNWIPRLGNKQDRKQAIEGQHATKARQAKKIAHVLQTGNNDQVKTLLRAVSDFHLRSGTYSGGGRYRRIGNDVRTIQFYKDSASELKNALKPLIESDDSSIRGRALLTAYTLRGTGNEEAFGIPFLEGLMDSDDYTRGVAEEFYKKFLPPVNSETEPAVLDTISKLQESQYPKARKVSLSLASELDFSSQGRKELARVTEEYFTPGRTEILPQALEAVIGLPSLWEKRSVVVAVVQALNRDDRKLQKAAVKLALKADPMAGMTAVRSSLDDLFQSTDPETQRALLELAQTDESIRDHVRVAELTSSALESDNSTVRQLALDLVRNSETLQNNAGVRVSLSELLDDPNARTRQIAKSIYSGKEIPVDQLNPRKLLDYDYFKEKVQPIFFKKGPDGKACYKCHHNHGILKLTGPKDGELTSKIARSNYRSALRVVDLAKPQDSLLLRKPLATSDSEGTVGTGKLSHGGELRWPDRQSSDAYQVIRAWINGARLEGKKANKEKENGDVY